MSNETKRPALELDGVVKRYRKRPVLEGVDLAIAPGECFGLVGVNGAGKTTCIKCMLDFCAVDAGEIRLFGVAHTRTEARSRLAYLPERFLPPYYLTGREFLLYMARLHGIEAGEAAVRTMFETLDLDPAGLDQPVREYSKGMAQKLGLAGCFLSRKELLVLDEPTSGLDPKARVLVKRHLGEIRSAGHTLFISTHMLFDVQELCDRMGILHQGRLRFVGTPDACCRQFGTSNLEQAYLACISA